MSGFKMVKLLVAITSWSRDHDRFLRRVLDCYRDEYSDLDVTVALSVNFPFDYDGPNIVRLPKTYDGWRYTWNAREFELGSDFDLLIESDDDVQINRASVEYYLNAADACGPDRIPGLLSCEGDRLITMHSGAKSVIEAGGRRWIVPRNVHSACLIIDRERWIKQTPSRTPTKAAWCTEAEYARSETYFRFEKAVAVDAIADGSALVTHLPNRYLGKPYMRYPTALEVVEKISEERR